MLWFKKKIVPKTNETREIQVVRLWEVRWKSRHGKFSDEWKEEVECFTSPDAAADFREALEAAFRLTKTTNGTEVTLETCK